MPNCTSKLAGFSVTHFDPKGRRCTDFVTVSASPGLDAAQLSAVLLVHCVNEEVARRKVESSQPAASSGAQGADSDTD
jgi:hypothetical protein